MNLQQKTITLLFAAVGVPLTLAADGLVPVPIPSDFGIRSIGSGEAVVYTELSGELLNPFDRGTIEKLCRAAREDGRTQRTPRFEAGHDRPIQSETRRFTNGQHEADYTVSRPYVCERPPGTTGSEGGLCGCTYRVMPKRSVHIRNKTAAGLEIVDIDVDKQTAQRRVLKGAARPGLDRGKSLVLQLVPEVVGNGVVAGIPCVLRRQPMGGSSHMDICITEDPDERLPAEMRYRALSEYIPRPDGKGVYRSSKANKIVLKGIVDSAVFAIPEGFTVKELK